MNELIASCKAYLQFGKKERVQLLLVSVLLGFLVSFRHWGGDQFDPAIGLANFILSIVAVGIALFVHVLVQKIYGIYLGYKVEFVLFPAGLGIAVLLAFLSNGDWLLLLPGGFNTNLLKLLRIGSLARVTTRYDELSKICIVGTLGFLGIAVLVKNMVLLVPLFFFEQLFKVSLLLAIFTLLPIPPLNGSKIIYQNRSIYAGIVAFTLIMALFLLHVSTFTAVFLGTLGGIVALAVTFYIFDWS